MYKNESRIWNNVFSMEISFFEKTKFENLPDMRSLG